jgi:hypothetical protein
MWSTRYEWPSAIVNKSIILVLHSVTPMRVLKRPPVCFRKRRKGGVWSPGFNSFVCGVVWLWARPISYLLFGNPDSLSEINNCRMEISGGKTSKKT